MDKSGGVTVSMQDCNSAEWKRQDVRLNLAYKKLMAQLSPTKKKELQEVQRLWLKYADVKCNFYYDNEEFNGTLDRFTAANCTTIERALRASESENLASH
jgi:uncharacterized protein YecT (DUF1311 family)